MILTFLVFLTKHSCFRCVLCGNITALYSLELKKTMKTPLWKIQVCIKSINVIMENNWSHKSGANSTWYKIAMNGFPLLSNIFIWTSLVWFAVTKFPYVNMIYLFIFTNDPGIKSKISGVMWQVEPESEVQFISYEMSSILLRGFCHL